MDKPNPQAADALRRDLETSWHRFLDLYEPLRPELYRYCRHLTRSPWDADDLVQDALFRAAFNAGDLDRLTSLLLDTAEIEVVRVTTQYGPEAARRGVFQGMLFGTRRLADAARLDGLEAKYFANVLPQVPRSEARLHRG